MARRQPQLPLLLGAVWPHSGCSGAARGAGACPEMQGRGPSLVGRQPEQIGLEVLQGAQHQGGLAREVSLQVPVGHHHHLHPSCQGRLHPIGSVFKDEALQGGEREKVQTARAHESPGQPSDLRAGGGRCEDRPSRADRPSRSGCCGAQGGRAFSRGCSYRATNTLSTAAAAARGGLLALESYSNPKDLCDH